MILEFSDQTPTEPRDKLPVKRSMNPSDASEDIDLTNNAAKQNLSKQSAQTPTEPRDNTANAEQTYFAIRGGKAKRVDAVSVVEAASVCGS
ncbi:hypothetical protein DPMN_002718 [Dreissena polymorpha]|uniref:Uncharacterized protein n=1 Tax=Dreissena polymorpha TaxID=45954 RepID=A0A9D4RU61_DREPO|nr:hypothetical protein DPMN_002718 [Dreissena polymorpha]